jgi:hypothetical protein
MSVTEGSGVPDATDEQVAAFDWFFSSESDGSTIGEVRRRFTKAGMPDPASAQVVLNAIMAKASLGVNDV